MTVSEKYKDVLVIHTKKSAVIEIPFTGNPQPSATWRFNDKQLPDPLRIKEETIYNMTTLRISKAKRSDSGTYSLLLQNEHGQASVSVKVKVIGKFSRHYFLLHCLAISPPHSI